MTHDSGFLIAPCSACDRRVLAAHDLDSEGQVVLVCVHCSAALETSETERVSADQLDEMGYVLEGRLGAHGERGCRDGACGVTQPDR